MRKMSSRKKFMCPNPMFLIWLEEWKKEAEDRGLNSKWTYAKAISSIKRYPLPLRSGKEAKILENVGDGIANRLEEKLKQYLEDGGDPAYLHKVKPVVGSTKNSKDNHKVTPVVESANNSRSSSRTYICKYRSGPYALILTLYQENQNPLYKGFMSKAELVEKAQPLCDKSFTLPDVGSHYTSWSSMGTLIRKGYVTKTRSPPQYAITPAGIDLAEMLLQGTHTLSSNLATSKQLMNCVVSECSENLQLKSCELLKQSYPVTVNDDVTMTTQTHVQVCDNNKSPVKNETLPVPINTKISLYSDRKISDDVNLLGDERSFNDRSADADRGGISRGFDSSTSTNSFISISYWYITDYGCETTLKSKALVTIDEELGLGFLIKVIKSEIEASGAAFKPDESRNPVDGFIFVYLADKDAAEVATTPIQKRSVPSVDLSKSPLKLQKNPSILDLKSNPSVQESMMEIDVDSMVTLQMKSAAMKCHRASLSSSQNSSITDKKVSSSSKSPSIASKTDSSSSQNYSIGSKTDLSSSKYYSIASKTDSSSSQNYSIGSKTDSSSSKNFSIVSKTDPSSSQNSSIGNKTDSSSSKNPSIASKADPSSSQNYSIVSKTDSSSSQNSSIGSKTDSSSSKNPSIASKADSSSSQNSSIGSKIDSSSSQNSSIFSKENDPLIFNYSIPNNEYSSSSKNPCIADKNDLSYPLNMKYSCEKIEKAVSCKSQSLDISESIAISSNTYLEKTHNDVKSCSHYSGVDITENSIPVNFGRSEIACSELSKLGEHQSDDRDVSSAHSSFIMQPGTFDIILCVDITETTGTGRRKKELNDQLADSLANLDIRKLQVGDFLWIAKEKHGQKRELVLDFIVERKRMDDLAGSIVDGRFREQKFRLKACGLKRPIYLVEKYGSGDNFPVPMKTLRQAITNTQLVDGFFVKETNDLYDSVNYLKLMTAELQRLYSGKTLHAVSMKYIKESNANKTFEESISEQNQILMTFHEFHAETNKSKMLTVSELFAKQLMQLKGVSSDRAMAIVGRYPSPLSLINAFKTLTSESEKENLLASITFGKSNRKVGTMVSNQVYIMYNTLNIT